MSKEISDLLKQDRVGFLQFGGARMALFDIEAGFWSLRRQIKALVGPRLADSVLQQAGVNGGASFARSFIGTPKKEDYVKALRDCLAAYQAAGFGEFNLKHLEPFDEIETGHGRALIEATDTFEAWAASQNGQPTQRETCAYTAGVLVGFVNVLAGRKDIVCVERSCQAKGDDVCRFELVPVGISDDRVEEIVAVDPDPALSRRLNLLEILFDRMPMGIVLLDTEFQVRRFNPTWAGFANRYRPITSTPVTPGVNFLELAPGFEEAVRPVFEQVLKGETVYQDAFQLKAGDVISYWDAVNTPLIENGEVVGILQVTVDVTDRVQAHQDLQQAVEQLRVREERLTLVMEGINDGIWDWDLKTDQVYFSPRWKEMLGYADEEVLNQFESWRALIHPKDLDKALAKIQDHLEGHSPQYNLEHRLRHKDGSYRWILARGTALRDGTGKPYRMVGSHTDITERKLVEESLRQSEANLRSLMENAKNFAVYQIAVTPSNPHGGQVVMASPSIKEILGISDPYDFNSWFENVHPEDAQRVLEANQRAMVKGIRYSESARWYHPAKRAWVWIHTASTPVFDAEGSVSHFNGLMLDISEQKQAEAALQESQRQLSTLISNLPGMAYRCRIDPDWTMEFVSQGSLELTGYRPEDLIDNKKVSYGTLIHPTDQENVWDEVQAALSEDRPFQFTYRIETPAGEKWVWEQGQGVSNSDEKIIALEGFITDITERVMAQQNLEQRVDERTHELTTLLDISHNLASTLDLEPLLDLILDQLRTVVDYDAASIMILEEDTLKILAYRGPITREEALQIRFSIHEAEANREVIKRREPVIIEDIRGEGDLARAIREIAGDELETTYSYLRCWMGVPLIVKDQTVGMLTLDHQQPGYYASAQAELAMAFASQAAVAIENARLYRETERRADESETLFSVQQAITSQLEMDEVLQMISDEARRLTNTDISAVYLLEGDELEISYVSGDVSDSIRGYRLAIDGSIAGLAVKNRMAILVPDTWADPRVDRKAADQVQARSLLIVPLESGEEIIGTITVSNRTPGGFTQEDKRLLTTLATNVVIALENARLYGQAEQAAVAQERNRLARDLHDAVTQTLFSASLIADVLPKLWQRDPKIGQQKLEELRLLTRGALSEMRTLLYELRPDTLGDVDLAELYRHLTNAFTGRTRIPVTYTQEGQSDLQPDVKEAFYRIVQEALNNINKHAEATQVQVHLMQDRNLVEVNIVDNGCGFDLARVSPENLGLKIMRERAEAVAAEIDIQSTPGAGTRVHMHWETREEEQ